MPAPKRWCARSPGSVSPSRGARRAQVRVRTHAARPAGRGRRAARRRAHGDRDRADDRARAPVAGRPRRLRRRRSRGRAAIGPRARAEPAHRDRRGRARPRRPRGVRPGRAAVEGAGPRRHPQLDELDADPAGRGHARRRPARRRRCYRRRRRARIAAGSRGADTGTLRDGVGASADADGLVAVCDGSPVGITRSPGVGGRSPHASRRRRR